eukprot:SAG31_NODE_326_length_17664_cov_10.038543_9_plen_108_part_00
MSQEESLTRTDATVGQAVSTGGSKLTDELSRCMQFVVSGLVTLAVQIAAAYDDCAMSGSFNQSIESAKSRGEVAAAKAEKTAASIEAAKHMQHAAASDEEDHTPTVS